MYYKYYTNQKVMNNKMNYKKNNGITLYIIGK